MSSPLEEFYALARAHEWTGFEVSPSDSKDDKTHALKTIQADKLLKQMEELTQNFSDEERLLFHLMAVSSWKSSEMTPKLYPLFQIATKDGNKYQPNNTSPVRLF